MLTMGWSDGHSFIRVDFTLLNSLKSSINGMMEGIDKRTSDYKRRQEALLPAPQVIAEMLDRAILTLTAEEIIRIYKMRWDIEVFYKYAKSLLRLQKEFQGLSYDPLVSHTTVVFSRYILLAWQHRQSTDLRSFGGLFYLLCDEVGVRDRAVVCNNWSI